MPDALFSDQRLAPLYDAFEGPRKDLDHYLALISELGAETVLDVGCGTGNLALLLARHGFDVTGVDPAPASLAVARAKPEAERVRWVDGDATTITRDEPGFDAGIMTGNVAQVFITDQAWAETLAGLATVIRPDGHLVFEVRDPARQAWLDWNRDQTWRQLDIPGAGLVTTWIEVAEVALPLISFTATYQFAADGSTVLSHSTLRFRERGEIEASLDTAGFNVEQVRDAPDRPGKEFVFVARRRHS